MEGAPPEINMGEEEVDMVGASPEPYISEEVKMDVLSDPVLVKFYIEDHDFSNSITMKVDNKEIGDFGIDTEDDGTLSLNIFIEDAYQGQGLSTRMIYLLCDYLFKKREDYWRAQMLFIDADGSAGFWEYCGLTINRYGYDWIRSVGSSRIVIGGGMEKTITFLGLFHFATLKSGYVPEVKYIPNVHEGGEGTTEDGVEEDGVEEDGVEEDGVEEDGVEEKGIEKDNIPPEARRSRRLEQVRLRKVRLARLKKQLAGGYKRAIKKRKQSRKTRKQSRKTRKQSRRIRKQSRKKRKHTTKHTRRKRRVKKL